MQSAQFRVDSRSVAADGCTTIILTSKKLPVFRKIICRYVLRCERKKRRVITFVSSNFHGLRTTARNLFILTRHYHKCGFRAHTNFRMTLCSIITPFTIFKMVSWSTSAELDVADPPENTWRWKKIVVISEICQKSPKWWIRLISKLR